ncbi:MAG TPA: Ig-like domain-containing protein, partial [Anaerolineae bacterium]
MTTRHHTQEEVRRYNWFKIIVLIILALLLLLLSLCRRNGQAAVSEVSPTAVPEDITPDSDTAAAGEATAITAAAPDTPQLTAPAPAEPLALNSEVDLVGTGTPGSDVRILLNGQAVETVRVGEDGTWRYTFTPEAAGELEVGLEAVDEGGEVQAAPAAVRFTVAAPEPEIAAATVGQPEGEVVAGDYTLTGSGTPGSTVEVVIDGQAVGTTEVNEDGTWSLVTNLARGDYEVSVRTLDADGNV